MAGACTKCCLTLVATRLPLWWHSVGSIWQDGAVNTEGVANRAVAWSGMYVESRVSGGGMLADNEQSVGGSCASRSASTAVARTDFSSASQSGRLLGAQRGGESTDIATSEMQ
jgi:hypothetical protein